MNAKDKKAAEQLRKEIALYDVARPVPNDNQTYVRGYRAGLERALKLIEEKRG